jgi:hypothetical protein
MIRDLVDEEAPCLYFYPHHAQLSSLERVCFRG